MIKPAADAAKDDPPGMAAAELKVALRRAKDGPLTAAFALAADGQAILRVHLRRPPRTLERDMKEAAPDSRNHRHGTVAIDPEQPKLLRFQINKAASGMARRLIVALKGTGFNKVEINSDDGAPPERHEEPEIAAPSDEPAGAPAAGPSPGQLVARLTELAKQALPAMRTDPALRDHLGKAHAALKAGALEDATTHADALQKALSEGASQAPPAAKIFLDLAQRWRDAERGAQADLDKLKAALDALYEGDPAAAQMEQDFQVHLQTVLGQFDGTFAAILQKAGAVQSDADLRKLKNDLIRSSVDMITFLGHDTISLIDSNPLVDANIAGRCAGVLKDLRAALN